MKDRTYTKKKAMVPQLLRQLFRTGEAPNAEPSVAVIDFFETVDSLFGGYFPLENMTLAPERYQDEWAFLRNALISDDKTLNLTDGLNRLQHQVALRPDIPLAAIFQNCTGVIASFLKTQTLRPDIGLTNLDISQALKALHLDDSVSVMELKELPALAEELYRRKNAMAGQKGYTLHFILNVSSLAHRIGDSWIDLDITVNETNKSITLQYTDCLELDGSERKSIEETIRRSLAWPMNEVMILDQGQEKTLVHPREAFQSYSITTAAVAVLSKTRTVWGSGYQALQNVAERLSAKKEEKSETVSRLLDAKSPKELVQSVCELILPSVQVSARADDDVPDVIEIETLQDGAKKGSFKPAAIEKALLGLATGQSITEEDMLIDAAAKHVTIPAGCIEKYDHTIQLEFNTLIPDQADSVAKRAHLKVLFDQVKKEWESDKEHTTLQLNGYSSLALNDDDEKYFYTLFEGVPYFTDFIGDPEKLMKCGQELAMRNRVLIGFGCLPGNETTNWWRKYASVCSTVLCTDEHFGQQQGTVFTWPMTLCAPIVGVKDGSIPRIQEALNSASLYSLAHVFEFMNASNLIGEEVILGRSDRPFGDIDGLIGWVESHTPRFTQLTLCLNTYPSDSLIRLLKALSKAGVRELALSGRTIEKQTLSAISQAVSSDKTLMTQVSCHNIENSDQKSLLLSIQDQIAHHARTTMKPEVSDSLTTDQEEGPCTILFPHSAETVEYDISQQLEDEQEEQQELQEQQEIAANTKITLDPRLYDDFDSMEKVYDRRSFALEKPLPLPDGPKFWDTHLGVTGGVQYATLAALSQMRLNPLCFSYGIDIANLPQGFFLRRKGSDLVLCFDPIDCPKSEPNPLKVELKKPPVRKLALYGSAAQFENCPDDLKSLSLEELSQNDDKTHAFLLSQCSAQLRDWFSPLPCPTTMIDQGLLMLLFEKGSEALNDAMNTMKQIDDFFGTYHAPFLSFFKIPKSLYPFPKPVFDFSILLEPEQKQAINTMYRFTAEQKEWFETLAQSQTRSVGPFDWRVLINGFQYFCGELEKLGLSLEGKTCPQTVDNMPVALSRILTILHNANDCEDQWEHLTKLPQHSLRISFPPLDLGPDGVFAASYSHGVKFVTQDMCFTPKEPYLIGKPPMTYEDGSKKSFSPTYTVTQSDLLARRDRAITDFSEMGLFIAYCHRYVMEQPEPPLYKTISTGFTHAETIASHSFGGTKSQHQQLSIFLLHILALTSAGRGAAVRQEDASTIFLIPFVADFSDPTIDRCLTILPRIAKWCEGDPKPTLPELTVIWKMIAPGGEEASNKRLSLLERLYQDPTHNEFIGPALIRIARGQKDEELPGILLSLITDPLTSFEPKEQVKILCILSLFNYQKTWDPDTLSPIYASLYALKEKNLNLFTQVLDRLAIIDESQDGLSLTELSEILATPGENILNAIDEKNWATAGASICVSEGVIGIVNKLNQDHPRYFTDLRNRVLSGTITPTDAILRCWEICNDICDAESPPGFKNTAILIATRRVHANIQFYLLEKVQAKKLATQEWLVEWAKKTLKAFCSKQKLVMGETKAITDMLKFEETLEAVMDKIKKLGQRYPKLWDKLKTGIQKLSITKMSSLQTLDTLFSVSLGLVRENQCHMMIQMFNPASLQAMQGLTAQSVQFILTSPQASRIWPICERAPENCGYLIEFFEKHKSIIPAILTLSANSAQFVTAMKEWDAQLPESFALQEDLLKIASPTAFNQICLKLLTCNPKIEKTNLEIIVKILSKVKMDSSQYLMATTDQNSILPLLNALIAAPKKTLEQLGSLYDAPPFPKNEWLLAATSLSNDALPGKIQQFSQNPFGTGARCFDLESADYSIFDIVEGITDLSGKNETQLTPQQAKDIMDGCSQISTLVNVGLIVPDGWELSESVPAYTKLEALTQKQWGTLLSKCIEIEKDPQSKTVDQRQALLFFLALACEAMYRINGFFPHPTQVASVLFPVLCGRPNVMLEIATGEGKTLVTGLSTAMLWLRGQKPPPPELNLPSGTKAVDVVTSSAELAARDYQKNKDFFSLMGIKTGLVTESSDFSAYQADGINYSTFPDLSLFRSKQAMTLQTIIAPPSEKSPNTTEKDPLLPQANLFIDEEDALVYDEHTKYRLSRKKPGMANTDWTWLYMAIYDFVAQRTRGKTVPVKIAQESLKQAILKAMAKQGLRSEAAISSIHSLVDLEGQLDTWIKSAQQATTLVQGTHFLVKEDKVIKADGGEDRFQRPVVLIKRKPSDRTEYSNGVQQFLCCRLELERLQNSPSSPPFRVKSEDVVISSMDAYACIQGYQKAGMSIMGLTGTTGSEIERRELASKFPLNIIKIPEHRPRQVITQCIHTPNHQKHLAKIASLVKKGVDQKRPVLIHVKSIEEAEILATMLQDVNGYKRDQTSSSGTIQVVTAENISQLEERTAQAGKAGMVTLSTIMDRGTDIKVGTEEEKRGGLLNIATDLSFSERLNRQRAGRAGRQGAHGEVVTILDDSLMDPRFFKQQQERFYKDEQKKRIRREVDGYILRKILSKYLAFRQATSKSAADKLSELDKAWGIFLGKAEAIRSHLNPKTAREGLMNGWNTWVDEKSQQFFRGKTSADPKKIRFQDVQKTSSRCDRMTQQLVVQDDRRSEEIVRLVDKDYRSMAQIDALYAHLARLPKTLRKDVSKRLFLQRFKETIPENAKTLEDMLVQDLFSYDSTLLTGEEFEGKPRDMSTRGKHLLAIAKYTGDTDLQGKLHNFYRSEVEKYQYYSVGGYKERLLHLQYAVMNLASDPNAPPSKLQEQVTKELNNYQKKWWRSHERKQVVSTALKGLQTTNMTTGAILTTLATLESQAVEDDIKHNRQRSGNRGKLLGMLNRIKETILVQHNTQNGKDFLFSEITTLKNMVASLQNGKVQPIDSTSSAPLEKILAPFLLTQDQLSVLQMSDRKLWTKAQQDLFKRSVEKSQELTKILTLQPELRGKYDDIIRARNELLEAYSRMAEERKALDPNKLTITFKKRLKERGLTFVKSERVGDATRITLILPSQNNLVQFDVSGVSPGMLCSFNGFTSFEELKRSESSLFSVDSLKQ